MGKTVLVGGVFDILHPGHVELLRRAKSLAGRDGKLIVLVARDSTVERTEGRRPVMPEEARRFILENLKPVDEAILGLEPPSVDGVLAIVKPDIVVLGYDQDRLEKKVREAAKRLGLKIEIVRVKKFNKYMPNSSSDIKRLIAIRYTGR
ncbi:MAG: FAD synthase [Candidatus Bathyarchaeota archaeon B24]|nr:MAG: FAD synthase [Candidatus Bathyarchaeota archaeon B24]RLI23584.1 MAG: FAD synthase [Candidatus Bathyarchaeota archaeon]